MDVKQRLVWADIVRGAAILLVILHHTESQIRSNLGDYPSALIVLNDVFAPYRMSLLMFLSGMLLARSLSKSPGVYLRGKVARIGWPYLVWSALMMAALAVSERGVTLDELLAVFYDPPTYLWYLAYLMVFYVVALLIPSARTRAVLAPVALIAAAVIPDDKWSRMLFLFGFFLLGDFCSRHWDKIWNSLSRPVPLLLLTALATSAAVASASGIRVNYVPAWSVCIAAIVVPAAWASGRLTQTWIGRKLAIVGRHSIVFYASHFLVLMVAFHLLVRVGVSNVVVLAVLLPCIAVAVGAGLTWLRRFPVGRILFAWPLKSMRVGGSAVAR